MAEPIPTSDATPTPVPAALPPRGTTRLSRVSGALAWVVGAWFVVFGYPGGYWPLFVAGLLMIWLGAGAWRGRRRRTIALVVVTALAAFFYPGAAWWRWTHTDELRDISYPGLWATILAIQSAALLTIAVTALLSLRRAPASGDTTPTTRP
jgi:hypothetical protein